MTDSPTHEPAPPPPSLPYAPPKRVKREVRKKDLLIVVLFLLALCAAYEWRALTHFYATTQAYLWQRRCLAHALPPGTIVYSEDPAAIERLLADPRYFRATPGGPAQYDAPPLREMELWRQDAGTASHGRGPYGGVFLHARRAPGAAERLVAVSVLPYGAGGVTASRWVSIYTTVVIPGTLTRFWEVNGSQHLPFALQLGPADRLTIFAGQSDPADASRFTIRYTLNDHDGTIDGWLRPDDRVELRPREGTVVENRFNAGPPVWRPFPSTSPAISTAPVQR